MRKLFVLAVLALVVGLLGLGGGQVPVAQAATTETIIWDPNGNSGTFTDPTPNFATILTQLSAPVPTTVISGGGAALKTAVAGASSGDVLEITDSVTYDGGIVIADTTDIVIRAAGGASPVIDCGMLSQGATCLALNATTDGAVRNIGIKGLTLKDIRINAGGSAATGMGIASFSGKILENIVIEDNVFDNGDSTKDQTFKGTAIHLNKVDGLLIRRNTILNGGLFSANSPQEDGAIAIHEFLRQPNYLNNVFIQNNEISFDYTGVSAPSGTTRGIVLAHTGKATTMFNNVVVEYNLIDNVQKEGIKIFGTSSDSADDETTHVTNNVIKRTANGLEADGGTVIIDSTIFDGEVTFGTEGKDEAVNHDGGSTTVSNTIVTSKLKGTTGTPTVTCIDLFNEPSPHPTLSVAGTSFNVDPMFVSPATNDYTIGNPAFPAGCASGSFGLTLLPSDAEGPITSNVVAAPNPVAVGTVVTLIANVDDSTTGGSNIASAEYNIVGDGSAAMSASDGGFDAVSEDVTASIPAFAVGLYTICVRGTDAAGNVGADECILLPVYDPTEGFVTGGGWINSPAGADADNLLAEGRATFGFVSKYKKGQTTPDGNLEFQFKAGDLNFKSTSMEWLVVTGEPRAQFRGEGTINGASVCKFQVDAWDGSLGGTDGFGIKIFACDAGGDRYSLSATTLGGGTIKIHKK